MLEGAEVFDLKQRASRILFLQQLRDYEIRKGRSGSSEMGMFEAFLFSFGSVNILRDNLNGRKWIDWKKEREKEIRRISEIDRKILKNRYKVMIHSLLKDRILSSGKRITTKGEKYLNELWSKLKEKRKVEEKFPLPNTFKKIESATVTLVTFDIPEKRRKDRAWIRSVLKYLGFEILHQSAWIGNLILPEEFTKRLKELGLLNYIHIMTVMKSGTLRE